MIMIITKTYIGYGNGKKKKLLKALGMGKSLERR